MGDAENPLVGHLGLELQDCQLTDLSNQSIGDWISNKETEMVSKCFDKAHSYRPGD